MARSGRRGACRVDGSSCGAPGGFNGGTITVEGSQSLKCPQFVDDGYRMEGPDTFVIDGSERFDGNVEIYVLTSRIGHIAMTITDTNGISKTKGGTAVLI